MNYLFVAGLGVCIRDAFRGVKSLSCMRFLKLFIEEAFLSLKALINHKLIVLNRRFMVIDASG